MKSERLVKSVIIIGASGHGKVIADMIQKSGNKVAGFLDDNPDIGKNFIGLPVLGTVEDYRQYEKQDIQFVIAIGNVETRERIAQKLKEVSWHTAIHPSAAIADIDVEIGAGTVVMANAVINSGTKIGKHCIINSGAIVEHDNRIDDFVHVSVGAKVAGTVSIGKGSWIGIGAAVKNNVNICSNCIVGAGAVVIKDIREAGTYIGVPAERVGRAEKVGMSKQETLDSPHCVGGGVIQLSFYTGKIKYIEYMIQTAAMQNIPTKRAA